MRYKFARSSSWLNIILLFFSFIPPLNQVACAVMAFPGMVWEQSVDGGQRLATVSPLGWVNLSSTGLLSFFAQMLKTLALQISKGVGVLVIR